MANATLFGAEEKPKKKKSVRKKTAVKVAVQQSQSETVFTVSDFLDRVNDVLAGERAFVQGEVSGLRHHPTGEYFSLKDKDANAVLNCYLNPRLYRALGIPLEDGLEVKIGGVPEVWKRKGSFSFHIETLELAGEGSLKRAYELLKKKLEAEGLFVRKRPLPEFIERVAIITSRTGAVIGDFRKNIGPLGFKLSLYDVRVEGASAVPNILKALRYFNGHADEFDVLILMRGGGSMEDLQAFNNELVAREFFASKIPTIAAVGHDRDVPLANLVADAEVSTPTAAAVLVNDSWDRLRRDLPAKEAAIMHRFERAFRDVAYSLSAAAAYLISEIGKLTTSYRVMAGKLSQIFSQALRTVRERLQSAEQYIGAVNPERNLKLGYSIVMNAGDKVVRNARDVGIGEKLTAKLYRGSVSVKVEEIFDTE